ncbi:hypothetical protein C8F01DRAFT_1119686 [Mycena amicta]|nr:hypothetical protein C8F01DRAFT_1119686 [Mycena amicta]
MAELDSLSDSEWLDVAHESDSDSSLTDSDGISLPPSRRSSISIPSDADGGEIEAWEGFADTPHDDDDSFLPAAADEQTPLCHPEEEQVTAGLDQSMVGTLSASRSSSLGLATVQNSVRDLRLSFPDPITSSRDELNRSYEAVEIPEAPGHEAFGTTDDVSNSFVADTASAPVAKAPLQDGLADLSPVLWSDGCYPQPFDVVLYGSSPQCREFAQWLMQTVFRFGGDSVAAPSSQSLVRLSLAIVSLPCSLALSEHTLYLPVVFDGADLSQVPENIDSLNIPPVRTLRLLDDPKQQYFTDTPGARAQVDPAAIHHELPPAFQPHLKRAPQGPREFQAHSCGYIVRLAVALLSIIMGLAANTVFHPSTITPTPATTPFTPAHTTPSTFWGMFGTTPNSSAAPPMSTTAVASAAQMPSTLKDLALAVFNQATTTPTAEKATLFSAPSPSAAGKGKAPVKADIHLERVKSSTDMIVRPQSSLSDPVSPKPPPAFTPALPGRTRRPISPRPVEESRPVTALSLKVGDSLSQVADATMKALEAVLPWDLRELVFAFDELLQAIGRQTTILIEDTKSQTRMLRQRLLQRNERAKKRARELRDAGERLASIAKDRIRMRAKVAKARAHKLREKLVSTSSHVWQTYAQAHGEWSEKLETKRAKRAHKGGLFAKLKQRRESRAKAL